jgi:hypothetical protein
MSNNEENLSMSHSTLSPWPTPKDYFDFFFWLLRCIASFGLLFVVLSFVLDRVVPNIATVDITGIVQQFVKTERERPISTLKKETEIKAFSHRLEATLNAMAKKHHCVLLPKEAVIAGAPDVTSGVEKQLQVMKTHG